MGQKGCGWGVELVQLYQSLDGPEDSVGLCGDVNEGAWLGGGVLSPLEDSVGQLCGDVNEGAWLGGGVLPP